MAFTADQIKGRLKNIAKQNNADARILMRIYMIERFLERVSVSQYADNFIIKGGILVTSMVGVSMRSTMDIDTTIRNINLSDEDVLRFVTEILKIDVGDNVTFELKNISHIMDNMEYPGIRIEIDAMMGKMVTPIKIDISTGDIITPKAIEYSYKLMLEDRNIQLWSYNLETVLSEKLQTILYRGILNTRMRDFYDIHVLRLCCSDRINTEILKQAFTATCQKRESFSLISEGEKILQNIAAEEKLINLWHSYQKKFSYAKSITFSQVVEDAQVLYQIISERG